MSEAIRKVSTIFTIDDNEHNKKLKELNSQYKLTQSEIKLAGERLNQFGKNTNDLKYKESALTKQTETLRNKVNLYKESIDKVSARAQENNKKLEELKNTKGKLNEQVNKSIKVYNQEQKKLEEASKSVEDWKRLHKEVSEEYGEASPKAQVYLRHLVEASKAFKQQSVVVEEASKALEENKIKLDESRNAYDEQKEVVNKNINTVNNYKRKINETEANLAGIQTELKKTTNELERQNSKWIKTGESLKQAGDKISNFGEKTSKVGGTLTKTVTLPVVAMGTAAVNAQVQWESAFADVRKTVDATEEQFAELSEGIREMSKEMPQSAVEIAGVAEAAGQLGIKTDSILGFSKAMVMLGDSTNMSSEEAATSLARLANITQMPQDEFDKLGSVVVHLGNNLATTESEIVAMGLRLAGAGKQIGLTEAQTLGLAGAFSSVGIEAEMGGSAISKVMVKMQAAATIGSEKAKKLTDAAGMSIRELELLASNRSKDFKALADSLGMTTAEINSVIKSSKELSNFGKIAGMTGEQFKQAFKEDAAGALIAFIRGLGNAESAGTSAIEMLEEMGLKEVRLRDSLLRAANAGNLLEDSINMGTKAWEDNTALTNEASQRYATTESQIKMLKNEIVEMAREIGVELLPTVKDGLIIIKDLIEKFNNLSPATKENIIKFAALSATLGPVIGGVGKLAQGFGGVLKVAGKISSGLGTAKVATEAVGTAAKVAGSASGVAGLTSSLGGVVLAAAPYVAAGAAIAGAGYAIYKGLSKEVIPEVDLFADKVEYTANSVSASGNYMATGVTTTVTQISKATKEAVGAYVELDDKAKNEMQNLYINSTTISEQIKNYMSTKFGEMATQVIKGYEKQRNESMAQLQEMFSEQSTLTAEEQANIMANTGEFYESKKSQTQEFENQINQILNAASQQKRALTQDEVNQITSLQNQMRENAVKALSQNEIEAQVILQRMKDYDSRITAEQASEHIRKLNESRDNAINIANDEYEKRIAAITRLRDEAGAITAEQADKMIEDAKRQRDGVVEQAKLTRDEAVDKIFRMNEELQKDIDFSSGEIISTWRKLFGTWDKWEPKTKFATVQYSEKVKGGFTQQAYALGTNYFQGGLTAINEKGYEVVELPRGSKIKNHLQSENIVKDTALQTARVIVDGLGEIFNSTSDNSNYTNMGKVENLLENMLGVLSKQNDIIRQGNKGPDMRGTTSFIDRENGKELAIRRRFNGW